MPTVTLDLGGLDLVVPCQHAGKAAKRRVGEKSYAFAGNERSHIRAELMVIPLLFVNSTPAICKDVEDMFALGNQVPCSGDVFNNGGATVVCSGDYTDDMEQGGGWRVPGLTLYEVENEATTAGGATSGTTMVGFSDTTSGDDPTAYEAVPGGASGIVCFQTLTGETPTPCAGPSACAITFSLAAERVWITPPLAATTLTGIPVGDLISKGTEGGSAFTIQSSKLVVYLCRGGFDVADAVEGPIESDYVAGVFAGGSITLTFPGAIAWDVEDGDQLRFELWSRIALAPGATDPDSSWPLWRQTICYGAGTGVRFGGELVAL